MNKQIGFCLWFTGLPCSGKTTVAKIIEKKRPSYLKAYHVKHIGDKDEWYGSRDGVVLPSWRTEDMEKIIRLKLSENEKQVSIDVTLLPHAYIQWLDSFENRAKKWPSLINELKEFIENARSTA